MAENVNIEELPYAKLVDPEPYYACPNCGGNCWGATNLTDTDEYIYACHGYSPPGSLVTYPGCSQRFRLPKGAEKPYADPDEA